MWITSMGNHVAVGGISECKRSSCSSFNCSTPSTLALIFLLFSYIVNEIYLVNWFLNYFFFQFEHPQQNPPNYPSQHSLHHTPQYPPYHTTSAIVLSTSKGTLILDCSQTYLVFIQLYDAPQRMGILVFVAPIYIHKAVNIQQCCCLKNTTFISHCADGVLRLVYHEIGGICILLLLSR